MPTTTLVITGMQNEECLRTVMNAIQDLPCIGYVDVSLASGEATAGDLRLRLERIHLHVCECDRLLDEQALYVGEPEAVEQVATAGGEARARAFGLRLRGGVAAARLEVEQRRAHL